MEKALKDLLASGKLEAFVLGTLPADERFAILKLSAAHPEVREEITRLEAVMERGATSGPSSAPPSAKGNILERLRATGWHQDAPGEPPLIHSGSSRSDFAQWLDQPTMAPPASYDDPFFIPIGQTPQALTAIVWMRAGSPEEVHTDVIENFLVIEGTCEIRTAISTTPLAPGSVHSIPLHVPHTVVVTSAIPCKVIVQRVAA